MKRTIYTSMVLLALLLVNSRIHAQQQTGILGIDYRYSLPLGSSQEMLGRHSANGIGASLLFPLNGQWYLGGETGFQDYYIKYPRDVYNIDKDNQISAVLTNSVQVLPLMLKGVYAPSLGHSAVKPYLSLAAGAAMVSSSQFLGEFGNYGSDNIRFMARGGVGVAVPLGRKQSYGLNAGADYSYLPYHLYGQDNLDSWGLHAGFYFYLGK